MDSFARGSPKNDRGEYGIIGATKKKTEVRQQQIIDAARILIFKYGSEHLTVKNIAAEVGITEGAIYKHFKSKKMILSFLLEYMCKAMLFDIAQDRSEKGPVTLAVIQKTIERHFSDLDLRKGVSFQVIAEIISLGDKDLNKQAEQVIHQYISALKGLLARGGADGSLRPDIDLEAAATLLFGLIQGVVNIWTLSNGGFELNQKFSSLWQVYSEALRRR
ncbi:MAG: TetR/AcrR family transcriptional regulator [Desulfobacterales bacterium]|nr:TetR/AcrR family transcriptional regulator [Desulfobacterales bacterium]